MIDLSQLPSLGDTIRQYDLWAKHKLGQHFLTDPVIMNRIARAGAPLDAASIIEIGPGPGGLTRALLQSGAQHLSVVEKDKRFLPPLSDIQKLSTGKLSIIEADALRLSLDQIAAPPYRIIANLPYNIATELIVNWLIDEDQIETMVVMVQAEVAQRIIAPPNSAHYGRLAVLCAMVADCEIIFTLPPSAFTPPPKVNSAVIRISPHRGAKDLPLLKAVQRVSKAAFGQRRKMLRAALKTLDCDPKLLLDQADIDGTCRAETLSLDDYIRLAKAYIAANQD
ncbi:MAG: 16S rRNA (adenine(1518)-N(6)/adenine(1519)-N(6))-dimethyltransferase RsmA [Alphaproteobacteria bacterium]